MPATFPWLFFVPTIMSILGQGMVQEVARAVGCPTWKILFRHILPQGLAAADRHVHRVPRGGPTSRWRRCWPCGPAWASPAWCSDTSICSATPFATSWTPACAAPAASPPAASRPARLLRSSRSTVGVLEHSGNSHYHGTAELHWTGDVTDRPGAVATAMILKSFTLTNFRGIRDLRFCASEPNASVRSIVGL